MKAVLDSNDVKKLLTLSGETLIVAKRQHPFILAIKLCLTLVLSACVLFILWAVLSFMQIRVVIQIATYTIAVSVIANFLVKVMIDWYFHIYFVSNRKILEIIAIPFYSDVVNDVFLDQVRTTEVDANIGNFMEEILNMGDVTIAFDRPSHDQLFVMRSITNPRETAMKLGDCLEVIMNSSPVWFKRETHPEHLKFTEDIYPNKLGVI